MGIVVVLLLYAVALSILATVGAVVLGGCTYLLLRRTGGNVRRAVSVAASFPYACVVFAATWFVAYAAINGLVMHRDPGLGGSWYTPLPNGYELNMIDTTDQGTVSLAGGLESPSALSGVRLLQVHGQYILGAQDTGYVQRLGQATTVVNSWFVTDALTHQTQQFSSQLDLARFASQHGFTLALRTFDSVFGDYRTTWFDWIAGGVLVFVPTVAFIPLVRWIWKTRARPRIGQSPQVVGSSQR